MVPGAFWSSCVHPSYILELWSLNREWHCGILVWRGLAFSCVCFRDLLPPGHMQIKVQSKVIDYSPSREGRDLQIISWHWSGQWLYCKSTLPEWEDSVDMSDVPTSFGERNGQAMRMVSEWRLTCFRCIKCSTRGWLLSQRVSSISLLVIELHF